jgi:hypothetical protein
VLFSENAPERLPVCQKMNSLPASGYEPNIANAFGFIVSFDGGIAQNSAILCVSDVASRCFEAKQSG